MSLKENIFKIWKNKGQIIEGITNNVFKRDDIEAVAEERMKVCRTCPSKLYDETGEGCMVAGTQPCCNIKKGGCGCSLGLKTRAMSAACEQGHWHAELTEKEEDLLNSKLAF